MPTLRWTNPIIDAPGADPFVFRADGAYWLVATGAAPDGRWLPLWRSTNLATWTFVRGAVGRGGAGAWNRYNFWAPEVLQQDGRLWLYYTAKSIDDEDNASNRVGLAVSERPEGPYEDVGVVVDHASLDASPFVDRDGTMWLYYVTDHGNLRGLPAGTIWVDRLLDPTRVADEPVRLIDAHRWQEGPVAYRQDDGAVRLTYSLGSWQGDSYRIVQARGPSPTGPFVERPTPVMVSTDEVKGPGHHNLFTGPDGRRWIVYHGWDPAMTARYPRIDRLETDPDGALKTNGPTSTEQVWTWE